MMPARSRDETMQFPPIDIPGDGALFATLLTSLGKIGVRLEEQRAPNTVANFVGLATGNIDWVDPKNGKTMKGTPFYDGLRVHRVVRNFVIQIGDPFTRYPELADKWGTGNPGYTFDDEFHPNLRHNRAGVLSMANSGRNSNGSQFFITEVPTPHLDQRHAVFGLVVAGHEALKKLANIQTGDKDRPLRDVVLERVDIYRG
jgi:peptidyl-prolyl cis-trans isomerase A (cyclophilin A)